jgi:hypothetical protein
MAGTLSGVWRINGGLTPEYSIYGPSGKWALLASTNSTQLARTADQSRIGQLAHRAVNQQVLISLASTTIVPGRVVPTD